MALPLPGAAARDDAALASVLGQATPASPGRGMGMRQAMGMMGSQVAQSMRQQSEPATILAGSRQKVGGGYPSMTRQQANDGAVLDGLLKQDSAGGILRPASPQDRNDDNTLAAILGGPSPRASILAQSAIVDPRQQQDDARLAKFLQTSGIGVQQPQQENDDEALLNLLASTTSSSARKVQALGAKSRMPPSASMLVAHSLNDFMLGFQQAPRAEVVAGGNGKGCQPHQLSRPLGIALDGQRGLLVADNGNHRVVRWGLGSTRAPRGEVMIDSQGYGQTLFDPLGVAVVGDGAILASVSGGIELWERGAQTFEVIASGNWPAGLAFDATGNVLFADMLDHCVRQSPGTCPSDIVAGGCRARSTIDQADWRCPACATWHSRRSRVCRECEVPRASWSWTEELHRPFGIAMDQTGSGVFVADSANNRVVHWAIGASEGVVVAGGKGPGNKTDQLHCPRGVALDGSGALLVADTLNHRVMRYSNPLQPPAGCARSRAKRGEVVAGGCGQGQKFNQLNQPNCIAVDADGTLYIADTGNHRVMRWHLQEQY